MLTVAQKSFWKDNGYLPVENVIPRELIAAEKDRFSWLCENWNTPEGALVKPMHETNVPRDKWSPTTIRGFSDLAEHEPVFRAHALHANLLNLVEQLIGKPFSLYETQALLKPPAIGLPKPPHQDNAYFQVDPHDAVITCWCALDDATLGNGCMMYVPASHKLGLIEHRWIEGTPHQVPVGGAAAGAGKPVAVPMTAGGVIFHHSLTLHMSGANRSNGWRRPFICHFVRNDADLSRVRSSTRLIPARG